MIQVLTVVTTVTLLGPGALAPADPLVLERVEMTRLRNGYGLDELAGPDVIKIAVEG